MVTDSYVWLIILGLALPATAISNITLVQAIKNAGPTLTSILGAMEPLTAVVIGVFVFNELFTLNTFIGILLILVAVSIVVYREPEITNHVLWPTELKRRFLFCGCKGMNLF